MVLWGAIFGGVLGLLWPGWWSGLQFKVVIGVAIGALAGRVLRDAVRAEIKAALAARPMPVAMPVPLRAAASHGGAQDCHSGAAFRRRLPGDTARAAGRCDRAGRYHLAAGAAGIRCDQDGSARPSRPAAAAPVAGRLHRPRGPCPRLAVRRQHRGAHGRAGALRRAGVPGEIRDGQRAAAAGVSAGRDRCRRSRAVRRRLPAAQQGAGQAGLCADLAGRRRGGAVPHRVRRLPPLSVPAGRSRVCGAGPGLRLRGGDRGGAERAGDGLHRFRRRLRGADPGIDGTGQSRRPVLVLPVAGRCHRRDGLGQGLARAQPAGLFRHLRRGDAVGRAEVPARAVRDHRAFPRRVLPRLPHRQPVVCDASCAGRTACHRRDARSSARPSSRSACRPAWCGRSPTGRRCRRWTWARCTWRWAGGCCGARAGPTPPGRPGAPRCIAGWPSASPRWAWAS